MIFVKLGRLMPEIIDFGDSNTNSTILYYFIRKKANRTDRDSNPRPLDPILAYEYSAS
jgi:hypothetical protein